MANRATITTTIRLQGWDEATAKIRAFRKELAALDGAKATVVVDVVGKAPASNPMIVDASIVNRALTEGMRLSPTMLADTINNGNILPNKMAMFIEGLNRELAKAQVANRGRKQAITSRKEYMKVYGASIQNPPQFLYFKGEIGRPINKVASNMLNQSIFK